MYQALALNHRHSPPLFCLYSSDHIFSRSTGHKCNACDSVFVTKRSIYVYILAPINWAIWSLVTFPFFCFVPLFCSLDSIFSVLLSSRCLAYAVGVDSPCRQFLSWFRESESVRPYILHVFLHHIAKKIPRRVHFRGKIRRNEWKTGLIDEYERYTSIDSSGTQRCSQDGYTEDEQKSSH